MSGKIGLFTGSFDPVTLGHVALIERASALFDQLYVGLFYNKNKTGLFEVDRRQAMLEAALDHLPTVKVVAVSDQLAVAVAKEKGVTHLVRGLRNATDLDYEENMAYFNRALAPDLDTVFLVSQAEHRFISSSRVRELLHFGADISPYVPKSVLKEVAHETD